jgi:formylmethanofuran dehydrogenase subunit E
MQRSRKTCALVCLALLGCLATARPVLAHHLGADCKVKDGKVEVEAFYDDDTQAKDAKVKLLDNEQKVVAEGRTDNKGRWSCPVPKPGMYVVLVDAGPGHSVEVKVAVPTEKGAVDECLTRVREIHGGSGPWAVAGYKIGQRALKELGLPRHSFSLLVIHKAPAKVQYSCVADGLQAATGASPGKLNLKLEEADLAKMCTVVDDRKAGRRLTFTLKPAFIRSIQDIPADKLEAEGKRVAGLADDDIFTITESKIPAEK